MVRVGVRRVRDFRRREFKDFWFGWCVYGGCVVIDV